MEDATAEWREHVSRWSLVRPAACMKEYMTVGPTRRNPRRTMSLLMASDLDDLTGIFLEDRYWGEIGLLLTNPHMYLFSDPNSWVTLRMLLELSMMLLTLPISMLYSPLIEAVCFSVSFETVSALNPANADLNASRFFSIVVQFNPTWAPESTSNSNNNLRWIQKLINISICAAT